MDSSEFIKLTPEVLSDFLARRKGESADAGPLGKRREPRWPFPGTVELWLPEKDGTERHVLATALNISTNGVGLRCDECLPSGVTLSIAVHLPEATYYGQAIIRYVTEATKDYIVGMQFLFV